MNRKFCTALGFAILLSTASNAQAIELKKGDAGKYVKLELYRNAKRYRTITKKTRNDGAFKWKIPASVLTGDKYQIRVTSTSIKKRYYLSDGFFTIK